MRTNNHLKTMFHHVILEGSAYEVGAAQGRVLKGIPGAVEFFGSGREIPARLELARTLKTFRDHCPGLEEEIQGFCEALEIPVEDTIYFYATYLRRQACSHLVALPGASANGHTLVARSYDFGTSMDDMRLCTTRITGKYAHLGFSNMFFGRNDGMNEYGLSVTTSAGGMPVGHGFRPPFHDGFQFWALARTILENCKTVAEAVTVFESFPICSNPILLFADTSGAAARAEAFGEVKSVTYLDAGSPQQTLVATNHFQTSELARCEPAVMRNSPVRFEVMQDVLSQSAPDVTVEILQRLLSTPYPNGTCCHYYEQFFGCLHAFVFDLNERRAEIAFGSPAVNEWRTFDLSPQAKPGEYETWLPQEQASAEFWEMIPTPAV